MIRIDENTDFYQDGEEIQLPSTFKYLMQQHDGSWLYGNKGNGRELKQTYMTNYGYGWSVTKIKIDMIDDCCEA